MERMFNVTFPKGAAETVIPAIRGLEDGEALLVFSRVAAYCVQADQGRPLLPGPSPFSV